MTRESKNNNNGAVFTYHERRTMDHGTAHLRLPAAALKPWHHCSLRLSSTQTPVLTPHGVLYDREAILLNLLQQKHQIRENRIKHDAEQNRQQRERVRKLDAKRREEQDRFVEMQGTVHHKHDTATTSDDHVAGRESLTANFWLPGSDQPTDNVTTQPAKRRKKDTSSRTVCPITGKPLKSRDLITLKPTSFEKGSVSHDDDHHTTSTGEMETSFICPVCQTVLVNSVKPVALRTGTIICKRCADDFVNKDARDPITGAQLDLTNDVIEIQNSGTAFAASSSDDPASKEAKLYRPSVR